MSVDVRAFLRSKGFEVGKRGRFSAEMLEAIKAEYPDLVGADGKLRPATVSSSNGNGDASPKAPRVKATVVAKPLPKPTPQLPVRSPEPFHAVSGNLKLVMINCFKCGQHTKFCSCKNGPVAPKGFTVVGQQESLV